jgi:4-carboxymuconolactone decarboxylase
MQESEANELKALFDKGLKIRREVLGAEYVDGSLSKTNDFMMGFQHITTEWCWGYAWGNSALDRRTRSIINLAMLTALGRSNELRLHVKGALTNGVTVEEIKGILLQATVYCGIPAGLDAFKAANQVLEESGAFRDSRG